MTSADMYLFEPARLISGRTTPVLTLAEVYVAVLQSRYAGQLMKCLSAELPLGPLQHLKRVRPADKVGEGSVEVLLCPTQDQRFDSPLQAVSPSRSHDKVQQEQQERWPVQLPCKTAALLASCAAEVRVQQVPVIPPDSREQWLEWCKVWPMPWRIQAGATEKDGERPSIEEQQYFHQHMQAALATAAAEGSCNVALIVDSTSGQVLAQAHDSSAQHPLHHAAMRAIEQVAARDRQLWPFNGFAHSGRHADAPDTAGYTALETVSHLSRSAGERNEADHSRPGKKQKAEPGTCIEEATIAEEVSVVSNAAAPNKSSTSFTPASLPDSSNVAEQLPPQPAPGANTGLTAEPGHNDTDWSKKPYLCTGYDCFLVNEPCYMCAMGLVHSRVARVIFCHADGKHGVLGGKYRLQAERTLNHHYRVYHMPLKQ